MYHTTQRHFSHAVYLKTVHNFFRIRESLVEEEAAVTPTDTIPPVWRQNGSSYGTGMVTEVTFRCCCVRYSDVTVSTQDLKSAVEDELCVKILLMKQVVIRKYFRYLLD
jgi:hypothetical protein